MNFANQIKVEFEKYVFVSEIEIYETYNAGGVKKIFTKAENEIWELLWETSQIEVIRNSRIFSPDFEVDLIYG